MREFYVVIIRARKIGPKAGYYLPSTGFPFNLIWCEMDDCNDRALSWDIFDIGIAVDPVVVV